jgi:hypothetical protein
MEAIINFLGIQTNHMQLKYVLIIASFLVLLIFILKPYVSTLFNEWKKKKNEERQAEIRREIERAKIAKQKAKVRIEKEKADALKQRNESLRIAKDKEVVNNNRLYKEKFKGKYDNARFRGEVQYQGAYRIPIAEYYNYDLNIIDGLSFFIDNLKSAKGIGKIEVRQNSFNDDEYDTYNLEVIDGFTILKQKLINTSTSPRLEYTSTYRELYLTIKENSFSNIRTGVIHFIKFTPYSVLDWK